MTKQCTKCKLTKEITLFYRHQREKDGRLSQCINCIKEYRNTPERKVSTALTRKKYRLSEQGIKKEKEYNQSSVYKVVRKKYKQSEKGKSASKRYRNSPAGRAAKARSQKSIARKKWLIITKERYRKHMKARLKLNKAVSRGKIPKISTQSCKMCSKQAKQYHHFLGYDKKHWFDVIPLCMGCHIIADGR